MMKTLPYPVSAEDFESLMICERVKIDHFAFTEREFELCLVESAHPFLSRDVVISSTDNGTELRIVRGK